MLLFEGEKRGIITLFWQSQHLWESGPRHAGECIGLRTRVII
jgi:hypothetical protein